MGRWRGNSSSQNFDEKGKALDLTIEVLYLLIIVFGAGHWMSSALQCALQVFGLGEQFCNA